MKFKRKAIEVELNEYKLGEITKGVRTREDGSAFVWNELHKSEINLEPGDFVNVSNSGDYYPIKKEIVASTYEKVE